MNRTDLKELILTEYNAVSDCPWPDSPTHEVFRHPGNSKWFALIMEVPRSKLGMTGDAPLDIVNLKCDPLLAASLHSEPGFFPAYHMNKEYWISAALDDSADDDTLRLLLDMSFDLTRPKAKKKSK